jgi:SAM-dependent methyltransferase
VDPDYGQRYRDLYQRHWWWRAREAVILREVRRQAPASGWDRILDIGCGDGLFFDKLSPFGRVEGVEPDAALLSPGGRWRHVIHAVPFDPGFQPEHRYDVVLMLDVLEHLEDPDTALRHACRLLSPRGIVVITVPAFQWLWTRHDELNRHVRRYDRPSIHGLARSAGLEVFRERYLFQWLVAAKLLVRGFERFVPGRPALPRIPPVPVNGFLTALTRLELGLTSVVSVPFGSSLLAIGRARRPSAKEA